MWDLPRPGLEPVSSTLAGRFLTTAPPGKPKSWFFENFNKIDKLLARLIREKREITRIINIGKERNDITADSKDIKRIVRIDKFIPISSTTWIKWRDNLKDTN